MSSTTDRSRYSLEETQDVRSQLLKIQQSAPFVRSRQMQKMIEFLVEATLNDQQDSLKETVIGLEVFRRSSDYDPKLDPVVRVEARRLRGKLAEYYLEEGKLDRVLIELDKGGYSPTLSFRELAAANAAVALPEESTVSPDEDGNVPSFEAEALPAEAPRTRVHFRQIWLWAGGALLIAALPAYLAFEHQWQNASTEKHVISSIAVLPFDNPSKSPGEEYFESGMTDALISRLGQIGSLTVVAKLSALQYRDSHKSLPELARDLKVDAVVEGSVVRAGTQIRIFARLLDAKADRYTWTGSFEAEEAQLFALQDKVARAINDQITNRLPDQGSRARGDPNPVVFEAYDAYLKGRYLLGKQTPGDVEKSIAQFQKAISFDSRYASAYAGLADSYLLSSNFSLSPQKESYEKALDFASEASVLEPSLAGPYATRGAISAGITWNWVDAETNYLNAIKLDPNSAQARSWYSSFLSIMGRHEEAIQQSKRAVALEPLSSSINTQLGIAYYLARRYDQAVDQLHRTISLESSFRLAHKRLGLALEQMGNPEQARLEFVKWGPLVSRVDYDAVLAHYEAVAGNRNEARKILANLVAQRTQNTLGATEVAKIYVGLGENDEAMEWLEKGFEERDVDLTLLGVDPRYDALRTDSRFVDLLNRLKLPVIRAAQ